MTARTAHGSASLSDGASPITLMLRSASVIPLTLSQLVAWPRSSVGCDAAAAIAPVVLFTKGPSVRLRLSTTGPYGTGAYGGPLLLAGAHSDTAAAVGTPGKAAKLMALVALRTGGRLTAPGGGVEMGRSPGPACRTATSARVPDRPTTYGRKRSVTHAV